jgi:ABC-type Mn2+/Zn2+ transport system permease subunit
MYLIISLGVFDGLYITFHLLQTEGAIALATEQDLFLLAFTIVFMILVTYLIYKPFTLTVDQQAVNKDLTRRKGLPKQGRYGNTENNISI